jgi:hypothetical protein
MAINSPRSYLIAEAVGLGKTLETATAPCALELACENDKLNRMGIDMAGADDRPWYNTPL